MKVLILLSLIFAVLVQSTLAQSEENVEKFAKNPRRYIAPFDSVENLSDEFADFLLFNSWMPKKLRNAYYDDSEKFARLVNSQSRKSYISVKGRLVTLTKNEYTGENIYSTYYPFSECRLVFNPDKIKMTFKTPKYKGIYYSFEGYFYETGEVYPESETIRLKGTLKKHLNSNQIFEVSVLMRPTVADVD